MADKARLAILYATQTGNALDAADQVAREANRRGFPVKLRSLDQYDAVCLASERAVVFVVSTTGQGDAPDSMKEFWKYLLQRNLTRNWLEGVQYAVFGLGDSGYQKYNFVAKKLDRRLFDLGAAAIVERGLGDDQHPCGYEAALDPWMKSLWKNLHETDPHFFPNDPDFIISSEQSIGQPKFKITYHDVTASQFSSGVVSDSNYTGIQIGTARGMSPGRFPRDKCRPSCFLKLIRNQSLTKGGGGRDVRHFEFEFVSSTVEYEVGDNLEVLPAQDPTLVETFMKRCNLDPDTYITVHPVETEDELEVHVEAAMIPMKLKYFVNLTMDVASASPRRYFFEVMSHFADAPHEKEKLQYFSSPEGRDDLYQYNQKERRTVLEVLEDFPSVQLPFEWLVQLVPPLKTRAFSISSSPSAHPEQVHLTVSVVKWTTPFKRSRSGLCSTWLSKLNPEQGIITVPAWFNRGSLPPPPPSLPLVLVGPGTGCAPFRGFIAERAAQSAAGEETAAVMLFFGCRNEKSDFLYREFWLSHAQSDGILSESKGGGFHVAFSRDQQKKVYVQHKIRENRSRVWDLLANGASVYVAGSSTKMPSDVLAAFEEVVSEEARVSREDASKWVKSLEKAGRYHVEAWS